MTMRAPKLVRNPGFHNALYLGVMFGTRRDKFAQWTSGSEMVTALPHFLWARDPYLRIFVIIPYHPDLLGGPQQTAKWVLDSFPPPSMDDTPK